MMEIPSRLWTRKAIILPKIEYNFVNRPKVFIPEVIKILEERYSAVYVADSAIKDKKGNFTNLPWAIFYTPKAHPDGSNYIAVRPTGPKTVLVTDGITATEPFQGILVGNDIMYSTYTHDFWKHNGIFVDGGRDYVRYGGSIDLSKVRPINLQIVKNKIEVLT